MGIRKRRERGKRERKFKDEGGKRGTVCRGRGKSRGKVGGRGM